MTLIETSVVMVIASAAMAAGANMYADYLNNLTNKAAAQQMNEVANAFSRYMDDNHLALRTQVVANGGRLIVPINDLKPDYLPDEFDNRSPYNQEYAIVIRRANPTSDALQGLVYTQYTDSNFALKPKEALAISRLIGNSAGYTGQTDPQSVISTYGNYQLDLANFGVNPGAGVLVSSLSVDQAANPGEKYLHRNVTGDPEHNRMNTHIDMNGNSLNNVDTVNATVGNIATVNAEEVNSNYTNAGVLTASSATVSGHTQTGTGRVVGRLEANSIRTDGSVDPGPGEIAARSMRTDNWFRSHGNSGWYSETYGGGWYMADNTWIRAYGDKSVYTPATMRAGSLQSDGNASVGGRLSVNEYLQLNGVATEGGGCAPDGLVGRTASGMVISCQSGIWRGMGGTNWYTAAKWSPGNTGWTPNTSGRSQMIIASTDSQPRDCNLSGQVEGWGEVVSQLITNNEWATKCSVTFMVPPGRSWVVVGGRFGQPYANVLTYVYTM